MLTLLLGLALAQTPAPARTPEMIPIEALDLVGKVAPPFEVDTLDGERFSLEAHRGETIVLSFWASWCGPCRQELPALARLQKERTDVRIYTVNVDRDPALARRFLQQVPFELPVLWDPEALALGQYEVLSMPTLFLLDRNLRVAFRKTGFSTERGLTELVDALAQVKR